MTIELHQITDYVAYWVLFWSLVNVLLPPREVFADSSERTQKVYHTVLMLVAYYGSLNLRQVAVNMYGVVKDKEELKKAAQGVKPEEA